MLDMQGERERELKTRTDDSFLIQSCAEQLLGMIMLPQRNKDAPASKLLQTFFRTYANWKWPSPVLLAKQNQPPKGGETKILLDDN